MGRTHVRQPQSTHPLVRVRRERKRFEWLPFGRGRAGGGRSSTEPRGPVTRRPWQVPSRDVSVAVLSGGATLAVYSIGAGRTYDYDSSWTVGTFVATRSLLDPFRRQAVFNNHPLFSFLEHLVYSSGARGEAALRVLPLVFGAAAVALVAGWTSRHWGPVAALSGGAVLAANPTYAELSRSVRGYSLVTFSAVCSTILLTRLMRRDEWRSSIGYVVVAAAGIATHLYALFPFAAQAVVVVMHRQVNRRWVARFMFALVVGALAYVRIGERMFVSTRREVHHFRPRFPLDLARALLGGSSGVAILVAVLFLLGLATLPRRDSTIVLATVASLAGVVWLWLQPVDLYPRFFVWAVAAVAVTVSVAVARWPAAVVLVIPAVAIMALGDARHWTQDPLPDRQAARLVDAVRARGRPPCVLPWVRGSLLAYTAAPREVTRPSELSDCDLVLGVLNDSRTLRHRARSEFDHEWSLPARTPILVYSRLSQSTLTQHRPARARRHPRLTSL